MHIMDYTMPNESNKTTISPSIYSLQHNTSLNSRNLTTLAEIIADCNKNSPFVLRAHLQILIIVLALPANAILLWLLVKNRKTLSPSEVLGLNFALLGVFFCLSLPLDIFISIIQNFTGLPMVLSNTFAILSYFGCPLLLTCMCLERYVAVAHPVLFMKLGKWEYRAACSAIIWFLTCIMAALMFIYTIGNMALVISIFISVLFFVMLACLLGIVCVLCKKGPGEGDQNNSAVKKRALKYVIAVLVPSTIIYMPMLGLAPFLLIIKMFVQKDTNTLVCNFLSMFGSLPRFGVFIGPMFYMARLRQIFCGRYNKSRDTRETLAVQRNKASV